MFLSLSLLVVFVVALVAIGLHFRWFRLAKHRDDSRSNVIVTVDRQKIAADGNKVLGGARPPSGRDHD